MCNANRRSRVNQPHNPPLGCAHRRRAPEFTGPLLKRLRVLLKRRMSGTIDKVGNFPFRDYTYAALYRTQQQIGKSCPPPTSIPSRTVRGIRSLQAVFVLAERSEQSHTRIRQKAFDRKAFYTEQRCCAGGWACAACH